MARTPFDQVGRAVDARVNGHGNDAAPSDPSAPLRRLDVTAMFTTPPPPVPWIVEPLLVRSHVTMIAGREGTGKSMLALAMAGALGNGSTVAGLEATAPELVLYVDAENGEGEIHRRVHGLAVRPERLVYMEAQPGFDLAKHTADLSSAVSEHRPG